MVLGEESPEMVVNSLLEILEEIMRLKRLGRLVPQVGKRRNEGVEMSNVPGFWEFHKKWVTG